MSEKPFIQIMSAVTLDGKLTLAKGLSSSSLMPYVTEGVAVEHHKGRAEVNAILVGATTVCIDDPSLTVRNINGESPARVIPDPEGIIPIEAKIFNDGKAKTIIAVTRQTSPDRLKQLEDKSITILECGSGAFVDLHILAAKLKEIGIDKLMVEGGATINNLFLTHRLVDELKVFLIPVVVGDKTATGFSEAINTQNAEHHIKLKLMDTRQIDDCLLLTYQPIYSV